MHSSLSQLIITGAQILVVGADQNYNQLLYKTLSQAGYRVITAANNTEALAQYKAEAIDLVLLNIIRLETEGLAFCQAVRSHSVVPIILIASLEQTDDIVRGLDLGADDAIAYPFTLGELMARIGALLRRLQWMAAETRTLDYLNLENQTVIHEAGQMFVKGTSALWQRPTLASEAAD